MMIRTNYSISSPITHQEQSIFKSMPSDIIKFILNSFPTIVLLQTNLVCRQWRNISLEMAQSKLLNHHTTIQWVSKHLNKDIYLDQRNRLIALIESPNFFSTSLLEKHVSILKLREKTLTILGRLDIEILESLHGLAKDEETLDLCEEFLDLAKIYKVVNEFNIPNEKQEALQLEKLVIQLRNRGEVLKAFNATKKIPRELKNFGSSISEGLLTSMTADFVKSGMTFKALEIAKDFPNAYSSITGELTKWGYSKKALEIINLLDAKERHSPTSQVSCELARKGDIEEAVKIAKTIQQEYIRNHTFNTITAEMTKRNDIDGAFEVVKLMLGLEIHEPLPLIIPKWALEGIFTILAVRGNILEIHKIINFTEENEKFGLLLQILPIMANHGHSEKAEEIALTMPEEMRDTLLLMATPSTRSFRLNY